MTDNEAWQRALEDARYNLRNRLETIEEQNEKANQIVRINLIIGTIVAAAIVNFQPSIADLIVGGAGLGGITYTTYSSFNILHSGTVGCGMPPEDLEYLGETDISSKQYYKRAVQDIYPKAINSAKNEEKKASKALNKIYTINVISIIALIIGGVVTYFHF